MLVQKASVFGRGARAVFPGEDIPAFWREASFGNAFDGSDPPGRWDPPFANLPTRLFLPVTKLVHQSARLPLSSTHFIRLLHHHLQTPAHYLREQYGRPP